MTSSPATCSSPTCSPTDTLAWLVQVFADLREAESASAQVRRDDRLRDEPDLLVADPERGAAPASSPPLASTTLVRRSCVASLSRASASRPWNSPLSRSTDQPSPHSYGETVGLVLDLADDEPAFDPEEIECDHADHLHPLWARPAAMSASQRSNARARFDRELVAELGGVSQTRHEDGDARDFDVLPERVVGEDFVREVGVGQPLEDLAASRPLQAEVGRGVRVLADDDVGPLGGPAEKISSLWSCPRRAEADVVFGPRIIVVQSSTIFLGDLLVSAP